MSYTKHTWVNNEVISASKLNNIEDGIEEAAQSGGAVIVSYDSNTGLIDKTFNELEQIMRSGRDAIIINEASGRSVSGAILKYTLVRLANENGIYVSNFVAGHVMLDFSAFATTDLMERNLEDEVMA